jgi:hypothetical protein
MVVVVVVMVPRYHGGGGCGVGSRGDTCGGANGGDDTRCQAIATSHLDQRLVVHSITRDNNNSGPGLKVHIFFCAPFYAPELHCVGGGQKFKVVLPCAPLCSRNTESGSK